MPGPRYWTVVPAAGIGRRLGGEIPKQYLPLAGRAVVLHALSRASADPRIAGSVVVLAAGDRWWASLDLGGLPVPATCTGGAERRHSVLSGLAALDPRARDDDWVVVHDAARPCLRAADFDRLLADAASHPVGGLLAVPVRDTLKHGDGHGEVEATLPRAGLWHAQTPQMFRFAALRDALESSIAADVAVTDEAQAMERAGHRPLLVPGSADNIKITTPEDLALAEWLLGRERGA